MSKVTDFLFKRLLKWAFGENGGRTKRALAAFLTVAAAKAVAAASSATGVDLPVIPEDLILQVADYLMLLLGGAVAFFLRDTEALR